MLIRNDPVHAFVDYDAIAVSSAASGPLAGLSVAVKDEPQVGGGLFRGPRHLRVARLRHRLKWDRQGCQQNQRDRQRCGHAGFQTVLPIGIRAHVSDPPA